MIKFDLLAAKACGAWTLIANAKIPWICCTQSLDEAGNTDGRLTRRTAGRRFTRLIVGSDRGRVTTSKRARRLGFPGTATRRSLSNTERRSRTPRVYV